MINVDSIISLWTLEDAVSAKLLPPLLARFDAGLENVISVILVCRFMLELRKWSENPNPSTIPSFNIATDPTPAPTGLQGWLQHINQTIIDEFGNHGIDYGLDLKETGMRQEEQGAVCSGINTEIHITAEEFPWAINLIESACQDLQD
ncbi:hypothetical protein M422DRAFT_270973 [Sphaerobolus stellatus SS14]|uniref:Uncharacterized protein n=1 Tax=Sphaerobolus stellatus (strain SS14) TaxID=990650 RepID=A0A0C9UFK9_SPHS4|nr:hypothetical protein M422DRAFT_270973 [Sphaerobolus stellatus SS14]